MGKRLASRAGAQLIARPLDGFSQFRSECGHGFLQAPSYPFVFRPEMFVAALGQEFS